MQELKEISIHEDSPTHSENESHETTSEKNLQSSPKKLWDKLLFFLFVYVYKPLKTYFSKWRGKKEQAPPMLSFEKGLLAFTGSCLSLGIIAVLHYKFLEPIDFPLMQGSFGAASVLLYAAPDRYFENYSFLPFQSIKPAKERDWWTINIIPSWCNLSFSA